MQPPGVIQFNASNVPVVQMTMSSKTLTEQQIFDYSLNFIRIRLFTIPGLSTPGPFGGKQRQINVDVDPALLAGEGLCADDVVNALQASNVIMPAGTARIGDRDIQRAAELQPQHGGPFQRVADRRVQRRACYHGRRRPRQRQFRHPDQHRARQRQARGLPRDPEACRRLHARRGRRGARRACPKFRPPRRTGWI